MLSFSLQLSIIFRTILFTLCTHRRFAISFPSSSLLHALPHLQNWAYAESLFELFSVSSQTKPAILKPDVFRRHMNLHMVFGGDTFFFWYVSNHLRLQTSSCASLFSVLSAMLCSLSDCWCGKISNVIRWKFPTILIEYRFRAKTAHTTKEITQEFF